MIELPYTAPTAPLFILNDTLMMSSTSAGDPSVPYSL